MFDVPLRSMFNSMRERKLYVIIHRLQKFIGYCIYSSSSINNVSESTICRLLHFPFVFFSYKSAILWRSRCYLSSSIPIAMVVSKSRYACAYYIYYKTSQNYFSFSYVTGISQANNFLNDCNSVYRTDKIDGIALRPAGKLSKPVM